MTIIKTGKAGFLCLWLIFAAITSSSAQEVLSLQEAVKIALERNFDIKIAASNVAIAENNVSRGIFLPRADATFNNDYSLRDIKQTQADGTVREQNGTLNNNLGYGVGLSWTVFDGFAMFARYDQLKELQKLGDANLQQTVLARVGDVISTYYNLVQQQQQLRAYDTAIAISRLRVNTAQARFEIGKAARLEVLNAQVDFNTDTTNLLRQRELYNTTRITLNELMARDVTTTFTVSEELTIDNSLTLESLVDQALKQNPTLQAAAINRRVAELDKKIIRGARYPSISLSTGYTVSRAETPLGFTRQSNSQGLAYGIGASVPLFNGFQQRRNEQAAEILITISELDYERIKLNLAAQLASAFQNYQTSLSLVRLEESNQQNAKLNLEITLEKFRLGSITTVEFRFAQLNYLNATVRYSNAQYQAKLAEVALRELAGNITL